MTDEMGAKASSPKPHTTPAAVDTAKGGEVERMSDMDIAMAIVSPEHDCGLDRSAIHQLLREIQSHRAAAGREGVIERRHVERLERHARKLLTYDGAEGSECYHAMKLYDARAALKAILEEIADQRALKKGQS